MFPLVKGIHDIDHFSSCRLVCPVTLWETKLFCQDVMFLNIPFYMTVNNALGNLSLSLQRAHMTWHFSVKVYCYLANFMQYAVAYVVPQKERMCIGSGFVGAQRMPDGFAISSISSYPNTLDLATFDRESSSRSLVGPCMSIPFAIGCKAAYILPISTANLYLIRVI